MAAWAAWLFLVSAAGVPATGAADGAGRGLPGVHHEGVSGGQRFGIVGVNGGRPGDAARYRYKVLVFDVEIAEITDSGSANEPPGLMSLGDVVTEHDPRQ